MFKFFMQGNNKGKEVFKRLDYISLNVDFKERTGVDHASCPSYEMRRRASALETSA